jgi:hypothetical protein
VELTAFVAAAIGSATLRLAGDAADNAAAALSDRPSVTIIAGSVPDALGVLAAAADEKFAGPARPLYLRPPDVSFPKPRANTGGRS